MHINTINISSYTNAQNNKSQNFGKLIKDKSVLPILNSMSETDKLEFNKIEKRLSKTKFWDLKISAIGNKFEEFKFHFINKKHKHSVITDGIYPYNKHDNTISIYSIFYGPENNPKNLVEDLKFKSKERADEVYDKYTENLQMLVNKQFHLTPVESLKIKEFELNMLEEGYHMKHKQRGKVYKNSKNITKDKISSNVHE